MADATDTLWRESDTVVHANNASGAPADERLCEGDQRGVRSADRTPCIEQPAHLGAGAVDLELGPGDELG
jgi:hypothetical protein